jgi:hypothetical protein
LKEISISSIIARVKSIGVACGNKTKMTYLRAGSYLRGQSNVMHLIITRMIIACFTRSMQCTDDRKVCNRVTESVA